MESKKKIEDIVFGLLSRHNCVVVPNFGALIINAIPAKIDLDTGFITPPKQSVLFNPSLKMDDGLLTAAFSISNKIEYTAASLAISDEVNLLSENLRKNKKHAWNNIGVFVLNAEGSIEFNPDKHSELSGYEFGLGKLSLPILKPEEIIDVAPAAIVKPISTGSKPASTTPSKKAAVWKWAASIIPVAALSAALLSGAHKQNIHVAGYTYFGSEAPLEYKTRTNPSTFTAPTDDSSDVTKAHVRYTDDKAIFGSSDFFGNPPVPVKLAENTDFAPYQIVGGCYQYIDNAEKAVEIFRTKGFEANIVEHNKGLFHVSIGESNNRQEAIRILRKLKWESGRSAWILKIR